MIDINPKIICERLEEDIYEHLIQKYESCKQNQCFISDCILVEYNKETNQFRASLDRFCSEFANVYWWDIDDKFPDAFSKENNIPIQTVKDFIEKQINEFIKYDDVLDTEKQ